MAGKIEELVECYGRYVYNLALKLTCDPHRAEDLAQETFLKAWLHMDQLKDEAAVQKWLRTICVNEYRMAVRKEGKGAVIFTDELEALERDAEFLQEVPAAAIDELETAEEIRNLRDGCFLAMVRKLTVNQRMAFSLVDMFGLTGAEASALMEVSPEALKGLLYRARMSLDSFFKGHCSFLDIQNPCSCQAWIDFMSDRDKMQSKMKEMVTVLDYRDRSYSFDLDTRQRVRHYYVNMPEKRPTDKWFADVIRSVKLFYEKA